MEIKKVKLSDLHCVDWNPRSITDEELKRLEESMNKFGYVVPIVWNEKSGNIVGGHQRFKILQNKLKPSDPVEVIVVNLEDSREKALNLALNKISGNWDEPKLVEILDEIKLKDLDLIDCTGFKEEEINNLEVFRGGEFNRPEFQDILEKFNADKGKCKKDENWFYVEFYGDDKLFKKLSKKVKFKGNSNHEVDPDFFVKLLK